MFCPKCGTQNPDGAKFCSGCGSPMPLTGACSAPAVPSTATPPASARPKRSKKPLVAVVAILVAAVAVGLVARFVLSGSTSVKTMHLAYGIGFPSDNYAYYDGFCFSVEDESASFALGDYAYAGKVVNKKETNDFIIYELGQLKTMQEDGATSDLDGTPAAAFCIPKGASPDKPQGTWALTVVDDSDAASFQQYRLSIDADGTCSYADLNGTGVGSEVLQSFESDPTSVQSFVYTVVQAEGTWSKLDKTGQFSLNFEDSSGVWSGSKTAVLELTDKTFDNLAKYYPDTPKATLTD